MHYILTDGQHPYQTSTPYSADPLGLLQNVRTGNFTLQCGDRWAKEGHIINRMLSKAFEERPTIEECLQALTRKCNKKERTHFMYEVKRMLKTQFLKI